MTPGAEPRRALAGLAYAVAASFVAAIGAYAAEMPRYDRIFIIIGENKSFGRIIGSPDAPRLNKLASEYGIATRFYGEVHPSLGNYVAMLGGDTFGIHDDDAWYCVPGSGDMYCPGAGKNDYVAHSLPARSLMDQLNEAGLSWKGYFEDLPMPGSAAVYDPSPEHPSANRPNELYAAKHNGFLNFGNVRSDTTFRDRIVPLDRLRDDLASATLPHYAHIVLNQCNDMHGLFAAGTVPPPPGCVIDPAKPETVAALIRRGDAAMGDIADAIMSSAAWHSQESVAIVITFDEDDRTTAGSQGCCGSDPGSSANFGGGHIPTVVVTNHGPRSVTDATPYNHYSLLRTTEAAFGLTEYLGFAGSADQGVTTMTPLFAVDPGR